MFRAVLWYSNTEKKQQHRFNMRQEHRLQRLGASVKEGNIVEVYAEI